MTFDDIQKVLELAGLEGYIRSGNVVLKCPFAPLGDQHAHAVDRKPSMGVLPKDEGAVFHCFTCHRKGKIEKLLALLKKDLKLEVSKAEEYLETILLGDVESAMSRLPEWEDRFKKPVSQVSRAFPDTWLKPYKGSVPKYVLTRGVTIETCKRWELGHDKKEHRVIFPVRDLSKKLVGAVGGLTSKPKVNEPKYKNYWSRVHTVCGNPLDTVRGVYTCAVCDAKQKVPEFQAEAGFKKSMFLYGAHLRAKRTVPVLVEGMFDTLKVDQALQGTEFFAVGIFGSSLSQEQLNQICAVALDRKVLMFLDNDRAGVAGMREANKLLKDRVRVFRADYSELEEGADPGSMTPEQINFAIQNAKVLL